MPTFCFLFQLLDISGTEENDDKNLNNLVNWLEKNGVLDDNICSDLKNN